MIKPLDEREKHNSSLKQVEKINEMISVINALVEVAQKLPVIVSKESVEILAKPT